MLPCTSPCWLPSVRCTLWWVGGRGGSVMTAVSEVYTMVGGREGGPCDDSLQ